MDELGMHAGAKPEIFRFAESLRANMTEEERKLWEYLRLKPKGFKFIDIINGYLDKTSS